jgi:hypothetical protein
MLRRLGGAPQTGLVIRRFENDDSLHGVVLYKLTAVK